MSGTPANTSSTTQPETANGKPHHDTGFPEPFSSVRNTTLPHPDAITNGNGAVQEIDPSTIAPDKTKHRLSFHRRHGSRHNKKDSVPEAEMYDGLQTVDSENKAMEDGENDVSEEEGTIKRVWHKLSRSGSHRSHRSR